MMSSANTTSGVLRVLTVVPVAAFVFASSLIVSAGQVADPPRIDGDDIGGVVTSVNGPETGVWVIAETNDLPTGYRKIVVTDDEGRYVVPDLPNATYDIWVRGYGLIDSPRVQTAPGRELYLTAVVAPNARAAAQYYPANYWLSLTEVPPKSAFPGTGPNGNGISPQMKSQSQWMDHMKSSCEQCHQLGDKVTRELMPELLSQFDSSHDAWERRVRSGQQGGLMANEYTRFGTRAATEMFASWTDRIANGELPATPPRPKGVERNVVITQWDWGHQYAYVHDLVVTDKRNPTVNANGLVYGTDRYNSPSLLILDPVRHTAIRGGELPRVDPELRHQVPQRSPASSPYWGDQVIWDNKENSHNPMMDHKGRVWATTTFRTGENPPFCQRGSAHSSAQLFPRARNGRQLSVYDPKTKETTLVDTCFGTHHLFFADDADNTLWTSGAGWLNTRVFDETGDAAQAQGWAPLIVDTNGNGRQDAWTEPGEPLDPTKDMRHEGGFYGLAPNPVDGSIWGAQNSFPGWIVRVDPGANPPTTTLAEIYQPPFDDPSAPVHGYRPRGIDVDRNGLVWTGLQSGHLASFDRTNCTVLNGPTATGRHCPEGWTLYPTPGPQFKGVTDSGSADFHYYNWVDQFNTFGLGENVPFAMGSGSDSLLPLLPDGQFLVLRVPYPMGFFPKLADGRIDDPNGGWKGRGLWATYSSTAPWHQEGGKGETSKVVKFQLRSHPLAR